MAPLIKSAQRLQEIRMINDEDAPFLAVLQREKFFH